MRALASIFRVSRPFSDTDKASTALASGSRALRRGCQGKRIASPRNRSTTSASTRRGGQLCSASRGCAPTNRDASRRSVCHRDFCIQIIVSVRLPLRRPEARSLRGDKTPLLAYPLGATRADDTSHQIDSELVIRNLQVPFSLGRSRSLSESLLCYEVRKALTRCFRHIVRVYHRVITLHRYRYNLLSI
jgi:hypothetical protein